MTVHKVVTDGVTKFHRLQVPGQQRSGAAASSEAATASVSDLSGENSLFTTADRKLL